jgi:hypothetical protein
MMKGIKKELNRDYILSVNKETINNECLPAIDKRNNFNCLLTKENFLMLVDLLKLFF